MFHPATRNYLEDIIKTSGCDLEREYGERFSHYYDNFLYNLYFSIGKENHLPLLSRFNLIYKSEYNDFDRAIELTQNQKRSANIARTVGLILQACSMLYKSLKYHLRSQNIHESLNDKAEMAAITKI